jgi:hypothetical protein
MPLISPVQAAVLRRHWKVFGAVGVLIVFTVAHEGCFRPTANRYQRLLKQASEMGLSFDAGESTPILPPRVFTLVSENSVPATVAQEEESSGTLTAELLNDLTRLTSARGLDIIVTEPVPSTQQPHSIQVRAHLRLQCRYDQFVALLADLAQGPKLNSVDRFTLSSPSGDEAQVEMWVSRYVLKQIRGRR